MPANSTRGAGSAFRWQGSYNHGPFTEAKEVVGGFAILKANSKQEAIEMAKHFLSIVRQGECELRQLYQPGVDSTRVGSADRAEVALRE